MSMDPRDAALLALERMTRLFEQERGEAHMERQAHFHAQRRVDRLLEQVSELEGRVAYLTDVTSVTKVDGCAWEEAKKEDGA